MAFTDSAEKIERIYRSFKKNNRGLRLGQFFCNRYVKNFDRVTDPLFNQPKDAVAKLAIDAWLKDNGYADVLPPLVVSKTPPPEE